jgi:hypothetical protein
MFSKMIVAVAALSALVAVPATAGAASSCRSTWVKASGKLETFFVPVAKLVCQRLNTDDTVAAQKCIADVVAYAAKAQEIHAEWNRGESSWTIGPRALPNSRTQTGAVSTERQFVGEPVITGSYALDLVRTDGAAKNDLIVKVCFVDALGNDVHYEEVRLNKSGRTSYRKTFTGMEGTFPLLHLNNEKWGLNAHQYTLRAEATGEPAALVNARRTVAAAR